MTGRRGRRVFVRIAAILAAAVLSAAPAGALEKERLTIGISQYPATLSPTFESMLAKSYVHGFVRRPITVYDEDWQLICLLCTGLPSLADGTAVYQEAEDSSPGIAVTYSLDPDAVWGDGTPITTEDVALAVEVGQNPETGALNAELFRRIERLEIHDAKRFTLHLNKRTCDFQGLSGLAILPNHIERPIYEEAPAEYRFRTAYDTDPTNPGLWYGPYRVARVLPGQSVLLERNPEWWGKAPYFEEISVRAIENTAALISNLRAGDIDMISGELGIAVDQAQDFESRHGDDFRFLYKSGLVYEHIDLNLDNPVFQDVRVRRALLHGIDRSAISEQLFGGVQPVAHGNVNPLDTWYDPEVLKYDHDPARAAALLEEAGWLPGPDGIRMKDGERLMLDFQTTAQNKTRELVQQFLQDQWRGLGIETRIDKNEIPRVFFNQTVSQRQFTGMVMYAWLSAPESVPRTTLHSEEIPTEENAWTGQNYPGYANPEMDAVLDGLETQCEEDDQRRLWSRMQEIYATDLPVLPLYFRANAYVLPHGLDGVRPTGHQFPTSLWAEDWRPAE
jgi:peptide/nickel transport system substrate-binding protein